MIGLVLLALNLLLLLAMLASAVYWVRLIRENWVLVDMLDVYHQLGVDVFERMREVTYDRQR